ncbi:dockerin type I domain-containing protein [Posidoniimonas polymericola]|uniref:dockerin type I domain-containing protein n=1 Tax=Posidoniimonas polymericola TaxID=2528002 RepID=UPI0011B36A87|nr:dockerin type I domain-containing protein [Posidoniimonas polymericola]
MNKSTALFLVASLVAILSLGGRASAREGYWQGDVSSSWNTAGNWFVVGAPGDGGFVPQSAGGFNVRAVLGTDSPNGVLNTTTVSSPAITAALPATKQTIGGLYFGVRELDYTFNPPQLVNPEPADGALVGSLTISGGLLNNVSTTEAGVGADGRIVVGQDGRGFLTMTGGTLTGEALVVGGETFAGDSLGSSLVDLSGASTLSVNGTANLNRRLRVEGPDVNFSSAMQLQMGSASSYTAAITSATAHSPLKVTTFGQQAIVDGVLNVEFSGAAATRDPIASLGTKWTLIDVATPDTSVIAGGFTNVGSDGSVAVSGLDAAHEAPLGATYALRKSVSGGSALLELSYEAVLILTVDRDTGEMTVRNPYGGAIAIDSYSVASANGSMMTSYAGLGVSTPGAGDWIKPGGNNAGIVSEVKVPDQFPPVGNDDAYDLSAVPQVSLGIGFDKFAVAGDVSNFGDDGEDLVFLYGGPETGDQLVRGQIEYVGSKFENNLVLRVNPNTGAATLKNDSLETLVFDGFTISSADAALSAAQFTPLSGGTGSWQTDAEGTSGLSQVNFTGARTLTPGEEVSIGDISAAASPFATDAAQDGLAMQFILAEGLEPTANGGDYNEDGVVDAADYTVWRDSFGSSVSLPNENPDALTPGVVDDEDYDFWVSRYGALSGALPETSFRVGSIFFDATLAGAAAGAATAAPEPAACVLLLAGLAGVLSRRTRQRASRQDWSADGHQTLAFGNRGATTMHKQAAPLMAFALLATLVVTTPALAVTGGIALTNFDMELPGPAGEKTLAFETDGTPIPGVIPGWIFVGGAGGIGEVAGLGNEDFNDDVIGDSGTEGSGFAGHGQEMLLSTNDGRVYQIASGHSIANPSANQQYKIGFDVVDIFTIDANNAGVEMGFELTARVFAGAYPGTTLKSLAASPTDGFERFEILIPRNDASLTAGVLGQSLGIEFDTTSREFNAGVEKSWAGIDNVVMEITGVLPGDLNGDGAVNLTDATNLVANMQASTPFEANGDLNDDNVVDLNDFRLLKGLISASAGPSAGPATVPEPSAAVMLLGAIAACMATLVSRRRRVLQPVVAACLGVMLAAATAQQAQAVLLAYDPFAIGSNPSAGEYTETTFTGEPAVAVNPLAGQGPTIGPGSFFTGAWTLGSEGQAVQSTGLSYLGTPSEGGSVNGFGRTDRFFATPWTDDTEDTFYIGLQVNFGDTPDADMGYRAIEFFPPNETPGENRVADIGYNQFFSSFGSAQQSAATAKMQFNFNPSGVDQQIIQASPASFNDDGLNHLLVLKFELTTAANGDRVSLYFDPKTSVEPTIPNNLAENFDFVLGAIGAASFGNGGGATTVLDEIRVATTFADALPPDLPIPGDCNGDMVVDFVDYQCIFDNMNLPGGQTLAQGDVNGDGKTTIADFRFWKERRTDLSLGLGAGPLASGIVPEPASLGLAALIGILTTAGIGVRRRTLP